MPHSIIRTGRTFIFTALLAAGALAGSLTSAPAPRGDVPQGGTLFQRMDTSHTGITFGDWKRRYNGKDIDTASLSIMVQSGGIGIADIDGDSLPDLAMTTYIEGLRIYKNLGGFKFKDITDETNVSTYDCSRPTGVTFGDVDGDGDIDLFLTRWNTPNRLFINDGKGRFLDRAPESKLDFSLESVQGSLFDADGDGDLDIYVVTYGQTMKFLKQIADMEARDKEMIRDGKESKPMLPAFSNDSVFALNTQVGMREFAQSSGPRNEMRHGGEPDRFFINNGDGTFRDYTYESWMFDKGMGLSCTPGDLNDDGNTDLYITNDFAARDIVYMNNGDATFANKTKETIDHMAVFSMGSDLADFNNDGLIDIVCVDMYPETHYRRITRMGPSGDFSEYNPDYDSNQVMRNALQLNRGDGTFSEIAFMAGVAATDWSWASLFFDADLDGWKDLLIVNGYLYDISDQDYVNNLRGESDSKLRNMNMLREPTFFFKNNRDLTFADSSKTWGVAAVHASMGAAHGDLDLDGDLDFVVVNIDTAVEIYRNMTRERDAANYVQFRLDGRPTANTYGVGTRVYVTVGGVTQMQELSPVRGFMSSVEPILTFGVGKAMTIDSVVVRWHGGGRQVFENLAANQRYTLLRSQASATDRAFYKPGGPVLLQRVPASTGALTYFHRENQFDDFKRERLLPTRVSWDGPGASVGDINGDGLDDVFVGGASGKVGTFLLQTSTGVFKDHRDPVVAKDSAYEDQGSILFDVDGDGDLDLYVASGGLEVEIEDDETQDRLYINDGRGVFTSATDRLPRMRTNTQAVAAADYDGDGDLDIFAGGRIIPGIYPHSPLSCLLRNDGGTFTDVTKTVAPGLERAGLVRSAVFSDVDGDSKLDLLIATEWDAIKVFRNDGSTFTDISAMAGTADLKGMWCSITPADVDNDGDMDYVAGNIGWNTRFRRPSKQLPIKLHSADFDDNGSIDPIITYIYQGMEWVMRDRATIYGHMPTLQRKYNTYEQFASAPYASMFDKEIRDTALTKEVWTTTSTVLINDGKGRLSPRDLPGEAQIAPMMGTCLMDLNDDGALDIVTVGNMFGADREIVKYDAGKGLVMLGDGQGGFRSVPTRESGFGIDADSRSLVCANSTKDGAQHLLVFVNQGPAYLYRVPGKGRIVSPTAATTSTGRVLLTNGGKRKIEMTYGGSYISQQPRAVMVGGSVKEVGFDEQGPARTGR